MINGLLPLQATSPTINRAPKASFFIRDSSSSSGIAGGNIPCIHGGYRKTLRDPTDLALGGQGKINALSREQSGVHPLEAFGGFPTMI
jgi:hypothetical protein